MANSNNGGNVDINIKTTFNGSGADAATASLNRVAQAEQGVTRQAQNAAQGVTRQAYAARRKKPCAGLKGRMHSIRLSA